MHSVALLALLFSVPSLAQPVVGSDAHDSNAPMELQEQDKGPDAELKARRQQNCDDAAVDKSKRAAWCQQQYVDAASCEKWVANECANFKKQDNVAGKASAPGPVMLAAKSKKTNRQQHCDDAAADKMKGAAWCQRNYVNAKDCDDWVANECADFKKQGNIADESSAPGPVIANDKKKVAAAKKVVAQAEKPAADIKNEKGDPNAAPASLSLSAGEHLIRNSSFVCLMISFGMLAHLGYSFMSRRRLRQHQEFFMEVNDPDGPDRAYSAL